MNEEQARVMKMNLDRQCSNGSYFYNGQAAVGNVAVDFTVKSRSQVIVDIDGLIEYFCLDHAQDLNPDFPLKPETFKIDRNIGRKAELQAMILAEFRRQYNSQYKQSVFYQECSIS